MWEIVVNNCVEIFRENEEEEKCTFLPELVGQSSNLICQEKLWKKEKIIDIPPPPPNKREQISFCSFPISFHSSDHNLSLISCTCFFASSKI